jgi:hypothetical protein
VVIAALITELFAELFTELFTELFAIILFPSTDDGVDTFCDVS